MSDLEIVPDWPVPPSVNARITTRSGGCSADPFATFNLAAHVGDDPAAVAANRAELTRRCGLPEPVMWLDQVHGHDVVHADRWRPGCAADASWTDRPGPVCAVLTADCLPVLFADVSGTVVAAAHAGWRGLAGGILEATVAALPVAAASLAAWLGPGIGPRHYEVGDELRERFVAADPGSSDAFVAGRPGHWQADLCRLARRRLAQAGVGAVFGGDLCTAAEPTRFFSYRRDGRTGRFASLVWLTAPIPRTRDGRGIPRRGSHSV